jgi:hypothetical protein
LPALRILAATEGDALTILGRWDDGLQKHREVMDKAPKPWQALSIEEQAIRIATLVNAPESHTRALADLYEGQEPDVTGISAGVS